MFDQSSLSSGVLPLYRSPLLMLSAYYAYTRVSLPCTFVAVIACTLLPILRHWLAAISISVRAAADADRSLIPLSCFKNNTIML